MPAPTTTASSSALPPFSVNYSPEQGPPQKLRFEPRDDNDGWWLIELRYEEGSWRTVGREPLTDVQWTVCEEENGRPVMTDSTPSRFELDLFMLVAQQETWRILELLTLLDEPVSHKQVAEFLAAFDQGTPTAVEAASTDTTTHDTTIADLDEAGVITDTANGLTRGPRFTEAFQMVPLS